LSLAGGGLFAFARRLDVEVEGGFLLAVAVPLPVFQEIVGTDVFAYRRRDMGTAAGQIGIDAELLVILGGAVHSINSGHWDGFASTV